MVLDDGVDVEVDDVLVEVEVEVDVLVEVLVPVFGTVHPKACKVGRRPARASGRAR